MRLPFAPARRQAPGPTRSTAACSMGTTHVPRHAPEPTGCSSPRTTGTQSCGSCRCMRCSHRGPGRWPAGPPWCTRRTCSRGSPAGAGSRCRGAAWFGHRRGRRGAPDAGAPCSRRRHPLGRRRLNEQCALARARQAGGTHRFLHDVGPPREGNDLPVPGSMKEGGTHVSINPCRVQRGAVHTLGPDVRRTTRRPDLPPLPASRHPGSSALAWGPLWRQAACVPVQHHRGCQASARAADGHRHGAAAACQRRPKRC